MIKDKNILIELHCLPSIEYFRLISQNNVTIEKNENYNKRSYRNKFTILSPNGVKTISIPLQKGKNNGMPINEVKIAYDDKWLIELERSLITNYKNAPYFDHYFDSIIGIFKAKEEYLFDLNSKLLNHIQKELNLNIDLFYTDAYEKDPVKTDDLRNTILPKHQSDQQNLTYEYGQVFEYKFGFIGKLSILDMLFNMGPEAYMILKG